MRQLVVVGMVVAVLGCSAVRTRFGPIGAGVATTVDGPGVEAAVSNQDGVPLLAGRLSVNVPASLQTLYTWVRAHLPGFTGSLLSTAPTPTGPQG